ncbi:hypothetical protein JKP88DRAFT_276512 [Tribonema minus]|uniref:Uncharacterized protein n=1 Tax=Tribonema minus TaxID=303371 RepID=A0A836CGZ1_9STRA|nr:hypothetical protein JKP88DRAFT_276512 [Tribonema minus]
MTEEVVDVLAAHVGDGVGDNTDKISETSSGSSDGNGSSDSSGAAAGFASYIGSSSDRSSSGGGGDSSSGGGEGLADSTPSVTGGDSFSSSSSGSGDESDDTVEVAAHRAARRLAQRMKLQRRRRLQLTEVAVEPSSYIESGTAITVDVTFTPSIQLKSGSTVEVVFSPLSVVSSWGGAVLAPLPDTPTWHTTGVTAAHTPSVPWTLSTNTDAVADTSTATVVVNDVIPGGSVIQFTLANVNNPAAGVSIVSFKTFHPSFPTKPSNVADLNNMPAGWMVVPSGGAGTTPTLTGLEAAPLLYIYYSGKSQEGRMHPPSAASVKLTNAILIGGVSTVDSAAATLTPPGKLGTLLFDDTAKIGGHWDAATNTLTLTKKGAAVPTYEFQAALRSVRYQCAEGLSYLDEPNQHTERVTITVTLNSVVSTSVWRDITLRTVVRVYTDAYPGHIVIK